MNEVIPPKDSHPEESHPENSFGEFIPKPSDRAVRLFLSVDICDCTLYKASHSVIGQDGFWPDLYQDFLQFHPKTFSKELKDITASLNHKIPLPEIWKILGDEIIYKVEVKSPLSCYYYLTAFYLTLLSYDSIVKDKNNLRIKCAAWTAGFPIRNRAIKPNKGDIVFTGSSESLDFTGLDMDAGFRLGSVTRPGRLAVSIDLAEVLVEAQEGIKPHLKMMPLHVGWQELKGVYNNKPYPVIWLNVANNEKNYEPSVSRWVKGTCPFAKKYDEVIRKRLQNNKDEITIINTYIKDLAIDIREELGKELGLVKLYFKKKDMPEEHKKIWEKWEKLRNPKDDVRLMKV